MDNLVRGSESANVLTTDFNPLGLKLHEKLHQVLIMPGCNGLKPIVTKYAEPLAL
jgi:hypothetical protein